MRKIIRVFSLSAVLVGLSALSVRGSAKEVAQNSFLCDEMKTFTIIGFSTPHFDAAICQQEAGLPYYYVGRDKKSGARMEQRVTWWNEPQQGANPWILKAQNGVYTYQVAVFKPQSTNRTASLSVFRNGARIYNHISNVVLIGDSF